MIPNCKDVLTIKYGCLPVNTELIPYDVIQRIEFDALESLSDDIHKARCSLEDNSYENWGFDTFEVDRLSRGHWYAPRLAKI